MSMIHSIDDLHDGHTPRFIEIELPHSPIQIGDGLTVAEVATKRRKTGGWAGGNLRLRRLISCPRGGGGGREALHYSGQNLVLP
jgi:hypothetical protein